MFMSPYCVEMRPRHFGRRVFAPQHCGLRPTPEDLLAMIAVTTDLLSPLRNLQAQAQANLQEAPESTIKQDKNKFQVNVDVQHFAPEEISVKTIDGYVVIEAKHEEKKDEHGFVSRSFVRRYVLPEDVDVDLVASRLSSDGILSITAPYKVAVKQNETVIPVIQTGPVKKQLSTQVKEENKSEENKSEENKSEENKSEENKLEENKTGENKTEE